MYSWYPLRFQINFIISFSSSAGKESACNTGDLDPRVPSWGWKRSPGNPLQYSCLENPHGQRSLAGYSSWGLKELDMTDRLSIQASWEILLGFSLARTALNLYRSACREYPHWVFLCTNISFSTFIQVCLCFFLIKFQNFFIKVFFVTYFCQICSSVSYIFGCCYK